MAKAIFKGTCQVCGREQKLPGNRLSKHGYTVEWNMFTGTCPGSGHLPYELSTDLIEESIQSSEKRIKGIQGSIQKALDPSTEKHWGQIYLSHEEFLKKYGYADRKSAGYRWIYGKIAKASQMRYGMYFVIVDEADQMEHYIGGSSLETPEAVAIRQSQNYVALKLEPQMDQLKRYILWQKERIKNWKARDLKPCDSQKS